MKSFEDTLPEEQEIRYRELMNLVQQARRLPVCDSSVEQEQALARVQQRLAGLEYPASSAVDATQPGEQDNAGQENDPEWVGLSVEPPLVPGAPSRRRRQHAYLLNTLAALLVVSLLIATSLFLFRRFPQANAIMGPPIGAVGTPVLTQITSGGFTMSMSITPGPYFLSELIAVDMSLTNHTQASSQLTGTIPQTDECGQVLQANLTGGSSPHFSIFQQTITYYLNCVTFVGQIPLNPGQTFSTRQYIPLINSGQNTLTARLTYPMGPAATYDPFKGHALSTRINVVPQIPVDRGVLSVQPQASQVQILEPSSGHLQLVGFSFAICQDAQGKQQEAGSFSWSVLTTPTLDEPLCPGNNMQWIYGAGAAGYAIVVGDFSP